MEPSETSHAEVARALENTLAKADAAGLGNTEAAQDLAGKIAVLRAADQGLGVEDMRAASRKAHAARSP